MAIITKAKKEEILAELTDKLGSAKSMVFTDYSGLSVADTNALRASLHEQTGEYKVVKHTLLKKIFAAAKLSVPFEGLDNHPLAVAWGEGDEVTVAKTVAKFGKAHESLEILGGVVSGEFMDAAAIKRLASLPGREELLAQALASMNAPVGNFVGTLRAVLSNTVYVLNAIKESKA